jgi:hypothetical protein
MDLTHAFASRTRGARPILAELSARLDLYLLRIRKELIGVQQHEYLWVGGEGWPMSGDHHAPDSRSAWLPDHATSFSPCSGNISVSS